MLQILNINKMILLLILLVIVVLGFYYVSYILELFENCKSYINTKKQALFYLIPLSLWVVIIVDKVKELN